MDARGPPRHRHRSRAQRADLRRLPGPRRPGRRAGRGPSAGRRLRLHGRRARRPGQHLQLRPRRVPHDAGHGRARPRRPRPSLPGRRSQRSSASCTTVVRPGRPSTTPSGRWPRWRSPTRARSTATAATSRRRCRWPSCWWSWPTRSPTPGSVLRRVADRRGRGVSHLLRWSRRSVAEVLRGFFREDAVMAPAIVVGPAVWGLSPSHPGHRARRPHLRHEARGDGRSAGRRKRVRARCRPGVPSKTAGGTVLTDTPVTAILCEGERVRGVELDDGTRIEAPIVVSACDPHATFVTLAPQPACRGRHAGRALARAAPQREGYESKLDAVISELPRYHQLDPTLPDRLGFEPLHATAIIAPTIEQMAEAHRLMAARPRGRAADVLRQHPVRARPQPAGRIGPRLQPRGALHAVPAGGRMGRERRARRAGWRCTAAGSSPASRSPSDGTGP